jgi:hypothetical protein
MRGWEKSSKQRPSWEVQSEYREHIFLKGVTAMTAEQIHYYDVEEAVPDKGWAHYTSRVPGWEGVDCRVADVVRGVEDVTFDTVGFINPPSVDGQPPDPLTSRRLAEEAVRISRFAPTWLDRIMTRSPLRDHKRWQREGKRQYLAQRKQRRQKFLNGTLVFVKPNMMA